MKKALPSRGPPPAISGSHLVDIGDAWNGFRPKSVTQFMKLLPLPADT